MWRQIRILILLLILLFVALNQYFDRVYSTDWDFPLRVTLYPINGDGSAVSQEFIEGLTADSFLPLQVFLQQEAERYSVKVDPPVHVALAPQLHELPPVLEPGSGRLGIALWSLRTRYWSWRQPDLAGPAPDIKLFLLFHDPERSQTLPHSVGIQKGLFGIVNIFADRHMMGANDTVIVHELLHTLGATDKYDLETNQPVYPIGYAEPEREPRYPQVFAELMAGRIPLSEDEADIPESLRYVIVGDATALEIGWVKP